MQPTPSINAFISYRRGVSWAAADRVCLALRAKQVDVFMDRDSMSAGKFPDQIVREIAARNHFLPILMPGALNRCVNNGDWVLREIEEAINCKRLIIPLYTSDFSHADIQQFLPQVIAAELSTFQGVELHPQFFDAAMQRLFDYLGVSSTEKAVIQTKELNSLYAEFYRIRNEYIRFSRSGNTDPNEHNRIISLAQEVCLKASAYTAKCPGDCFNFSTDPGANLDTAHELHDACRHHLEYIAVKWLTPNQVERQHNSFEADLWGEYRSRNEAALDEAKALFEQMLRN